MSWWIWMLLGALAAFVLLFVLAAIFAAIDEAKDRKKELYKRIGNLEKQMYRYCYAERKAKGGKENENK